MNPVRLHLITLMCLFSIVAFSQKTNIWITYGQSKFMYSPGVEVNYFFNQHIGLQMAVNTYFEVYNPSQIVNITDDYLFNFYNANLGLSSYLLYTEKHKIGVEIGFEMYYGPEFVLLHKYEQEGYSIYYDSSELRPSYGADFGIFYTFQKISTLIKFDTARKKMRFGIGYTFDQL
ncbi:MAG: hypothetical protein JKY42_05050 [Flavobacteriales bacterium]|nr:hypothetical protein [Flavobacteriales bacterium]